MRRTAIVLLMLCVVAVAAAAPVVAENPGDQENEIGPCVTVYLDPPGAVIDPWCLIPEDLPPI